MSSFYIQFLSMNFIDINYLPAVISDSAAVEDLRYEILETFLIIELRNDERRILLIE